MVNILLAAHAKGLGAVWTTVFPHRVQAVKSLLKIPDNVQPFSCVPIGFSAEDEKDRMNRFDKNKVHCQTCDGIRVHHCTRVRFVLNIAVSASHRHFNISRRYL